MQQNQTATDLAGRIDRLESIEAIKQLAVRYALAVDMGDIDSLVNLYVPDIKVSAQERGRQAIKKTFSKVLRSFTTTVHHIGGHVIEFDDPDNAHGLVYTRAEHEMAGDWVTFYGYYLDIYRRLDGHWYLRRRALGDLFSTGASDLPVGDDKIRWPGSAARSGTWHAHFPTWREFWDDPDIDDAPVPAPAPPEGFLDRMRRGDRSVRPPDFGWAGGATGQGRGSR